MLVLVPWVHPDFHLLETQGMIALRHFPWQGPGQGPERERVAPLHQHPCWHCCRPQSLASAGFGRMALEVF